MRHDAFLILGILVAGFSGCASNSVSDTTNDGANSKYTGPNNCKFLYPSSFFENINIFKKPISRNDILSAEKVTGSIGTTCENGFSKYPPAKPGALKCVSRSKRLNRDANAALNYR